jgi:rubrerythrin
MELNTASQVISFAREMEEQIARLYEAMSGDEAAKETLTALAAESRKNAKQIERVYYEVITDALEGCFAFRIDRDAYPVERLAHGLGNARLGLGEALAVEKKAQEFYSVAAQQSGALLADIPRLFTSMAKKREDRISKLKAMRSA